MAQPAVSHMDHAADTVRLAARPRTRRPMGEVVIAPDRWLHSATVDELRAERARIGLPVPPRTERMLWPPQGFGAAPHRPAIGRERRGSVSRGVYLVLCPLLGTVVGLLAGVIAALIVLG